MNVLSDALIIILSMLPAFWIRFHLLSGGVATVPLQDYLLLGVGLAPIYLTTFAVMGLYESFRRKRLYWEVGRLFYANLLVGLVLFMFLYLFKIFHFSRLALFFFFLISTSVLGVKRVVMRMILRHYRQQGYNQKRILIIGNGPMARRYLETATASRELGYQIIGYIAGRKDWEDVKYCGNLGQISIVLEHVKPDEVVAALEMEEYRQLTHIIEACEKTGVKLSVIPFYADFLPAHPQIDDFNGIPMLNIRRIPLDNAGNAALKRLMDVCGALTLIVLTSPVMLAAAIGVKLSSPGPVIFQQKRVGRNKRQFYMYKFRSMRVNDRSDVGWSTNRDTRKTKIGALLRKFSIDELPQFFNVLKGDMSLVGPRPEVPYYVEQFKEEIPLYMVKHQVRPGITGWAQVNGLRGDTSIEERIRHDIYYIENWSILFDVKILIMTLFKGVVNQEKLA